MTGEERRTPGEVLGQATDYVAGAGTYVWQDQILSSVVGAKVIVPPAADASDQRSVIEVRRGKEHDAVPKPSSVVTAKITKVQLKMAYADILCVGPRVAKEKFTGIIRQQDVRATEIDKVDMHASYCPGDIVRAEVLSLGDARAYYLSTAKDELGVISATSESGATMTAVTLHEMQCPVTKRNEPRKVAGYIQ